MKKVIVTGAGGFIGSAIVSNLLEKGITVYGVDAELKYMENFQGCYNFIPVKASYEEYPDLHKKIVDDIDVFYHFAWQGGFGSAVFKDYDLQLKNTKYACDALMAAIDIKCKKFVLAGTVNEYEMNSYIGMDYIEPRYTYIYSVGKQASEAIGKTIAFNSNIEFCCGRIVAAYGENSNSTTTLPNVMINNLNHNRPSKLIEGNNLFDMIYKSDIAEAFYLIGEMGKNMKSYYVGHRKIKTFKEVMQEIADILNPGCPLLFGEYPDVPSGINYDYIDVDALYNDTGFECKSDFRESILRTAEWVKTLDF